MKIAVLIAGEYREFRIAHKFWSFLSWPDVDCYFATWDKSIRVDKNVAIPDIVDTICKEDITDNIKVANYQIANQEASGWVHSSEFMIDRWKAAIVMMQDSGIEYDKVILIRPDLALDYDENLVKEFMEQTAMDDNDLYGIIFGPLDQSVNMKNLEQVGDLVMFGTKGSILKLLDLPMQPLLDSSNKQLDILKSYPPATVDIHHYLGKNIPLLYKRMMNLPIRKNCVVRSNCRDLINPTFGECKMKAREWWETRYKAFYSMLDNTWDYVSSQIQRNFKKNCVNLWENYDTNPWWECNQVVKWHSPDDEERFNKNFVTNKGYPSKENKHFCSGEKFVSYSKDDIEYSYNSYGFRSTRSGPTEFEDTLDYPIFLVGGCSVTEGIGMPEDHLWHSQLLRKIITAGTKKPIAKFNVGKGGRSIDSCIRFVYNTIEHKKLKPDCVYLLLPPIIRREMILGNNSSYYIYNFINSVEPVTIGVDPELSKAYRFGIEMNDLQRVHDSIKNLLLLKWYLHSKNIPWFFSSWSNDFGLGSLTEDSLPAELQDHYIPANMCYDGSLTTTPFQQNIARDCMHYGPNSHHDLACQIIDKLMLKEDFQKFIRKTQSE
jgi:hypothetical protein